MKPPLTKRQKAHRRYLTTKHWAKLRAAALERDEHCCQHCGRVDGEDGEVLNVHHKIYHAKLRDGVLEDVVTLCQTCHRLEHDMNTYLPFDKLKRILERNLNYEKLPSIEYLQKLVCLASEDERMENEVRGLLRHVAGMRIILTSSKMWDSWLKKGKEVSMRLWPWSKKRLEQIRALPFDNDAFNVAHPNYLQNWYK